MNDRDIGYAIDILLACREIEQFGEGKEENALLHDRLYQAAVLRKLEIIGEVAKRLSVEFKSFHGEINWRGWAGLRDKLIHGYDEVNLEIIRSVLVEEIPKLRKVLSCYEVENQ